MKTLQAILVPVDGSSASLAAIDHATALALDYGARIEIFHVVPINDPLAASARSELEQSLDTAVVRAQALIPGCVERYVTSGEPVREIIERARSDFDLIVMGTHGHSGRLHSILGSVAESVVRNAPCPVLTVRDRGTGYQSFADRRHGRPSIAEQARDAAELTSRR